MAEEPKASILIVDDERGPRESLRMILHPSFRVTCAKSGSEALERLENEPIDVVTLDLKMPGTKGEEVMRRVREAHPHVEIIVITGCGSLESATEGIRFGICDYPGGVRNRPGRAGTGGAGRGTRPAGRLKAVRVHRPG